MNNKKYTFKKLQIKVSHLFCYLLCLKICFYRVNALSNFPFNLHLYAQLKHSEKVMSIYPVVNIVTTTEQILMMSELHQMLTVINFD
jgi:hypothetical protein